MSCYGIFQRYLGLPASFGSVRTDGSCPSTVLATPLAQSFFDGLREGKRRCF